MYRISLDFISDMMNIILRKNLAYTDGEKNAETGSTTITTIFLILWKCSKTISKYNLFTIFDWDRSYTLL